jgi:hypothetical protein
VRQANEEERMNGTRKKRASQVGLTSTVATTPLRRPPLEAALDAFTRELRGALGRATAETTTLRGEVAAIRAELQQLRQRHDAHTHNYLGTSSGGGGQQWIELRFLQSYIDGEQPGYKNYGIWARGKSTTSAPPEYQTSGPSA